MGNFIEDLRREMAVKAEAQRIAVQLAEKNAERERIDGLARAKEQADRKEREARIKEGNLQKIKEQVEQTGLKQVIQEMIDIKAAWFMADGKEKFETEEGDNTGINYAYKVRLGIGSHSVGYYDYVHVIGINVSVDGTVTFEGSRKAIFSNKNVPLRISIGKDRWWENEGILEKGLRKVHRSPLMEKHTSSRIDSYPDSQSDFGFCLPGNSSIRTLDGVVSVNDLKIGNLVWTVDKSGHKVQAVILQKTRRFVSKDHRMVHITLEDGRKLIVSPGHPTIDNKELGSLKNGQLLDNSKITSIKIMLYKEKYTYDILPAGDTGAYWANGILIGSTLSAQFKKIQEEKYSQLFV